LNFSDSEEEGMMGNRRRAGLNAAIGLIFITLMFYGCGGGYPGGGMQPLQSQVTTEYMLGQAGFTPYKPNMETPRTQALLDALPEGTVTTFRANGVPYHAYPDKRSNVLYVGDEAAYEKYVGMAKNKNICRRVEAPDSSGFWGCYQELQQKGAR